MNIIPFDEIVPGASVRVVVIDGVQYLSIRDIVMALCEKNANDSALVWRRLSDDHKDEVQGMISTYQFPGRGQSPQPVITFPGICFIFEMFKQYFLNQKESSLKSVELLLNFQDI